MMESTIRAVWKLSSISQEFLKGILILRNSLSNFLAIHIKSVEFLREAGGHAWERLLFENPYMGTNLFYSASESVRT